MTDSYSGHVKRLIAALNLESRVRFLGYVPDLIVAMGAADIVTMPSHEEPYGLVALEGMALGKPVVATGAGGVPSFIRDGDTGLLVPPRDPAALANALSRLLDDPDAARAMGGRARARVEAEFDVAHYMTRFVPILHEALRSPAGSAFGTDSRPETTDQKR